MTRRTSASLTALLTFAVLGVVTSSQTPAPPKLPTLNDLQVMHAVPGDTWNLTGAPDYATLERAATTFAVFNEQSGKITTEVPPQAGGPNSAKVYRAATPCVVFISGVSGTESGRVTSTSQGTGVILYPSGDVLTNWHIVKDSVEKKLSIYVFLKPDDSLEVRQTNMYVVHADYWNERKDLALLKFDKRPANLKGLSVSTLSTIEIGTDVHIVGHPRGPRNAWNYLTGTVSEFRRGYQATFKDGQEITGDVLQIQSSIDPGDSGGPILDDNAYIVGLVSFGSDENLRFGIAASEITALLGRRAARRMSQARGDAVPQPSYASGKLADGRQVVKVTYPGRTAYLLVDRTGRVSAMVAEAGDGTAVEAWSPNGKGGFNNWSGRTVAGAPITVVAANGQPVHLVAK